MLRFVAARRYSAKVSLEPDSRVTVKMFATRDAANAAASQLEANGIASWITADDCGGLLPSLSLSEGVRLLVLHSDLVAACELLGLPVSPETAGPGRAPQTLSPTVMAIGQIFIGVVIGAFIVLSYKGVTAPRSKAPSQSTTSSRHTYDDYAPNGKRSARWIYVRGRLTEHLEDRNLDGAWDHWTYFDDNGRVERIEDDNNFDGKPDETWFCQDGHLVSMEKDTDFNGVSDEFCTYRNEVIQQDDFRPNGSKFTTVREIFSNGVLTEIWRGGDSSGVFREIVKYDAFLNPVSTNLTTYPLLQVH